MAAPDAGAPDSGAAKPDADVLPARRGHPAGRGPPDGGPADAGTEAPPTRCPDLDDNGKLDCDENLLVNAGFDQDLRGWSAETNTAQAFVTRDGQGRANSGAIAVTNAIGAEAMGGTLGGSWQCLDARAMAEYQIRGPGAGRGRAVRIGSRCGGAG